MAKYGYGNQASRDGMPKSKCGPYYPKKGGSGGKTSKPVGSNYGGANAGARGYSAHGAARRGQGTGKRAW